MSPDIEFAPKLIEDGSEFLYFDGRVSGVVGIGEDWVVIYEWNSAHKGRGFTKDALTWLSDGGRRSITAYNMGMPPAPGNKPAEHVAYWLRMKDIGLVQHLIDDDGDVFDERFRLLDPKGSSRNQLLARTRHVDTASPSP